MPVLGRRWGTDCSGKSSRTDMDGVFVTFVFSCRSKYMSHCHPWWYAWVICVRIIIASFRMCSKLFRNVFCFGQVLCRNSSHRWSNYARCNNSQSYEWRLHIRLKMKTSAFNVRNCYLFWWMRITVSDNIVLGWWWIVGAKKKHRKEKSIKANAPHRKRMREVKWSIDFFVIVVIFHPGSTHGFIEHTAIMMLDCECLPSSGLAKLPLPRPTHPLFPFRDISSRDMELRAMILWCWNCDVNGNVEKKAENYFATFWRLSNIVCFEIESEVEWGYLGMYQVRNVTRSYSCSSRKNVLCYDPRFQHHCERKGTFSSSLLGGNCVQYRFKDCYFNWICCIICGLICGSAIFLLKVMRVNPSGNLVIVPLACFILLLNIKLFLSASAVLCDVIGILDSLLCGIHTLK